MKSVLLCSPGRSGLHWVEYILKRILPLSREDSGQAGHFRWKPETLYVSHDLLSSFAVAPVDIVVIVRHPADAAISAAYYNAREMTDEQRAKMERFWGEGHEESDFALQMAKKKKAGHRFFWWADYVECYESIPHLLIRYEEMKQDPVEAIHRLVEALGAHHALAQIAQVVGEQEAYTWSQGRGQSNDIFYRRGITGEWREHFTEAERKRFARKYRQVLSVLGYQM